jgi:hypothetical protein
VNSSNRVEVIHVGEIHARADHVHKRCTGLGESFLDSFECFPGLFLGRFSDPAGGGSCDEDLVTDLHGEGVPEDRFVG